MYVPTGGAKGANKEGATEAETVKAFQEVMEFIGNIPLFKRLPAADRPKMACEFVLKKFSPGSVIIRQGDDGNEFFVIKSGQAKVTIKKPDEDDEMHVATLGKGDYFGEGSLLRNEPRNASITATEDLLSLSITRENFEKQNLREKLKFARREAVAAVVRKVPQKEEDKGPTTKTQEEKELIIGAVEANGKLMDVLQLDQSQILMLADKAWRKKVPEDTELIKQGDLFAEHFYIVQSGQFGVFIQKESAQSVEEAMKAHNKVGNIHPGASFGELALMYHAPRAATVKAQEDSEVWVVGRRDFKDICMRQEAQKTKEIADIVRKIDLFQPLLNEEREKMAQSMVEISFKSGEIIIEQNAEGDSFWLLTQGEIEVVKDGGVVASLKANYAEGGCPHFGETALLYDEPRTATIRVVSQTARALVLDRESFVLTLGSLSDLLKAERDAHAGTGKGGPQKNKKTSFVPPKRSKLKNIGLLGVGGFGSVSLQKDKETGKTYAMKAISKGFIVKMDMQDSVANEKDILMMTDSPFIIKLYATYNSQSYLLFLLECALGGELFSLYHRKNLHGKEYHARYYAACVIQGFQHLHERRIIYRDLKPENLLLDSYGVCKITDMGLAKFVIAKTFTTCGTPDYFAPEVISATGHNRAVDWWGLGILIFELMAGHPPFETSDPMLTYKKIMQGIGVVCFPHSLFNEACEDMVVQLCMKDPAERIPMRKNGMQLLQNSAWYKDFSFQDLIDNKIEAPIKPKVKSVTDTSNFFVQEEDLRPHIPYISRGETWDSSFATAE